MGTFKFIPWPNVLYKDYHMYLKEGGIALAEERARLCYIRHKKVSIMNGLLKKYCSKQRAYLVASVLST